MSNKKLKLLHLLLFIIALSQATIFYFLLFSPKMPHPQPAPESKQWQKWNKLAKNSYQRGDMYQAIYFYEKTLKQMPEQEPAREEVQNRLSFIYDSLNNPDSLNNKAKSPQDIPYTYKIAEESFRKGEYKKARRLFYEFLAQVDTDKKHKKLLTDAYFRIQQCLLFANLEQNDQPKKDYDRVVLQALQLMKK